MDMATQRGEPPRRWTARDMGLLGVTLLLVLCLGCCGLGVAFESGGLSSQLGGGYVVQVCVGVNTVASWQVGVTWIAPTMSSLPPVRLQNPACALVPWLPYLPLRGGFALP
jgi:hypothetical protein